MRKILTLLLCASIGLAIVGCDGSGEKNHIGKTYKTAFHNFKVVSAEVTEEYAGITADEGYKLVDVVIASTNSMDEAIPMYDMDYMIVWGEGEEEWDYCYYPEDATMAPEEFSLPSGETMTYHYLYAVPEAATNPGIWFLEIYEGTDGEPEYGSSYYAYFKVE